MNIDKSYLTTILELSCPEKIFKAHNKNFFVTSSAYLDQLFCNCESISTQKNIAVVEKYETILNINAEIRIQKHKLAFWDKHIFNFLLTSMPSIYESLIDNLNICKILMLAKTVCSLKIKETKLNNLRSIKK